MGRIDPLDDDFLTHPALPLSLLVAATAATIAIISSFCAFWRTPEPDLADSSETAENSPDSDVPLETEQATAAEEEEEATQALPPPPCMRALTMTNQSARTDRCSSLMKKSVSARRISSASVKKHFRSISVREIMDKNKHKPDDSHSLCQKHIILGGKCKVGVQVDADAEKKNTGPETQSSLENPDAIADKVEEEQGFGF
ncbi:hypothetical protein HRI_002059200 [Hibiscus trionum]|uniref:Uncharacterized protein n=1 Tax=Hibiscus trionum TaxID=183268 RepID=A0A9W7M0R3_HIBTR|nr:hypothetical protein HRI_002059200 [Hibiscus trionum]